MLTYLGPLVRLVDDDVRDVAHGAAALLQPAEDDARSAEEQPRLLAHLGLETDRVAQLSS